MFIDTSFNITKFDKFKVEINKEENKGKPKMICSRNHLENVLLKMLKISSYLWLS